jgi:hypothetical protein
MKGNGMPRAEVASIPQSSRPQRSRRLWLLPTWGAWVVSACCLWAMVGELRASRLPACVALAMIPALIVLLVRCCWLTFSRSSSKSSDEVQDVTLFVYGGLAGFALLLVFFLLILYIVFKTFDGFGPGG